MKDDYLRNQINDIIRDEIQEVVNDYVDETIGDNEEKKAGFKDEKLEVNIPNNEVDKLIKEYKKIKRKQKSNFSQIKKLGLVDKNGKPLK
tara:strand:+ start:642 stop:911 length:270 start_codon:yes stop_codon:yes gene_type:complete